MTTIDAQTIRGAWDSLSDSIDQAAESIVFGNPNLDSPVLQGEGIRYLTRQLALGACTELEAGDPAYPQFFHLASAWWCYGAQNPDATYWFATLDGAYTYRIFGTRGTSSIFDVEIWEGDEVSFLTNHNIGGLSDFEHGARNIEVGPDGEIEILLSRSKQPGNWCALPPGRGWVLVRQICYDWENEQVGDLYIERMGAEYPPPPVTEGEWASRLSRVGTYLINNTAAYAKGAALVLSLPPNTFQFQPMVIGDTERGQRGTGGADQFDGTDHYFMRQLVIGQGNYRCEPNEAVILEVPAPRVHYWNYYLMSPLWEGVSWNLRQSSINGHQAVLDPDGMFRAVIAHQDPGVPNWLDTGGHTTGLIAGRLFQPESVDTPTMRVVALDEVRKAIPTSTPEVSPAQRSEAVRRRMHAVRRRRCDF